MTYYQAALQVLGSARHPLTTREITDRATERGLIRPSGKTPYKTMEAVLYGRVGKDDKIVKVADQVGVRARKGTVRWVLRRS